MAYLIPETLARLQATGFVGKLELDAVSAERLIVSLAKTLADQARDKLLRECIKVEDADDGGKRLRLDVYVIAPEELHSLLDSARTAGAQDALYAGLFLPPEATP